MLFLCTGNASRSVIAGAALSARRPDLDVRTAGTFVIDGLPLSIRTQSALSEVGLSAPGHLSDQATAGHLNASQLVMGLAPEHVEWIRREHPTVANRTLTLVHLARETQQQATPIIDRLESLDLSACVAGDDEEIVDPGGGEVDAYIRVAHQIVALMGFN